jgi:pimeloyl-ACP methyl ester carboxylesterase
LTDSFFPPSRNGRSIAATARDYVGHRMVLARDMAARRSGLRPSGANARGLGSLARLGLRPGAFHKTAAAVRAPVLVVHARNDHHVPVDFALSAAKRHPAWTVRILDVGGHNAHAERPNNWLAATQAWLDELAT